MHKVLELINENNQISAKQISAILKVTSRTVKRDIEKLKQQNKLKRIGGEKSGRWEVMRSEEEVIGSDRK